MIVRHFVHWAPYFLNLDYDYHFSAD